MFLLYSLAAQEALTKSLTLDTSGNVVKGNYPAVKNFTSHTRTIDSLTDFYNAIVETARQGHCLIKGTLHRDLDNESRAGATETDDTTHWLCLDLDGLTGFTSVADFMDSHPELHDISYIVQYSASSGLPNAKGLRAHIFVMLSHEYHASYLKGWLIRMNVFGDLFGGKIMQQLSLNRTQSVMRYPIDITVCQNDKLIYVAPPIISPAIKYATPSGGFIQLVKKAKNQLPIERLECGSTEQWKTEAKKRFNILRKEAGLDPVAGKTKLIDGFEIEPECGEFHMTGHRSERGFEYFNMNGGDSWSWWHPSDNHKYIHCFKDDRVYLTQRILPKYYLKCERERRNIAMDPSEGDTILLAFRDLRSAAYFNGLWNPSERTLELHHAKDTTQLDHFLQQHGKPDGITEFVPQWKMEFNPRSNVICDPAARYLNTYVPTPYFLAERAPAPNLDGCPTIQRIILSAVSGNEWNETTEHFLNWLAVIFQHKVKTTTCWVLHGTEGTGKGLLATKVLTPLLGKKYVQQRPMKSLEDNFNGWLEEALIAVIDEVQISASAHKAMITSTVKHWISEEQMTIRNMNRVSYMADSYTNFLIFSNKDDIVVIDDRDRRYSVGMNQPKRLMLTGADVARIETELPYFMDYIMQRSADIDLAHQIMINDEHAALVLANKTTADLFSRALLNGDMTPLIDALPDIRLLAEVAGRGSAVGVQYASIVLRELNKLTSLSAPSEDGFFKAESRLSRDELYIIYEHAVGEMSTQPGKFTRYLGHRGVNLKKLRIDGKPVPTLTVTWVASREWIEENKVVETKPGLRKVK